MQEHSLHRGRLVTAIAAAAVVVGSSPYVGDLRSALLVAFPSRFPLIIGAAISAVVIVAVLFALTRIRDRRAWRFIGLSAGVGAAMLYARLVATGNLLVDVVEHVHFIEYGVVAWLFYRACLSHADGRAIVWPLLAGTLTGIVDESVQAYIPGRVGEAHDVFLDVVAVGCGLCFAASVDPPRTFGIALQQHVVRPIAYGVSAVVLTFAAFFQAVHLGHEVYEPAMGLFWSHYDARTLVAMGTERAAHWRLAPPMTAARLSHEDEYLSEGLWHVQERNRAWGAGDLFTAWRENLILERYYAPVLEAANYASKDPARWPPAQRGDTAARVGSDPGIYVSRAAPYPIYAWPPLAFWLGVLLVIVGVMTAC